MTISIVGLIVGAFFLILNEALEIEYESLSSVDLLLFLPLAITYMFKREVNYSKDNPNSTSIEIYNYFAHGFLALFTAAAIVIAVAAVKLSANP